LHEDVCHRKVCRIFLGEKKNASGKGVSLTPFPEALRVEKILFFVTERSLFDIVVVVDIVDVVVVDIVDVIVVDVDIDIVVVIIFVVVAVVFAMRTWSMRTKSVEIYRTVQVRGFYWEKIRIFF
jgi:hypothetical protein